MKRISEDLFNRTVTYELSDGKQIKFDMRAVQEHGVAKLMREYGLGHLIPTERVPVLQHGKRIGSLPPTFEPAAVKSTTFMYDVRPGDFRRDGDVWIADRMLGPGDLEAVPGFVWDRNQT